MSRRFFWLPLSLAMALLPGAASASEVFPDAMKTALAIPGPKPLCMTCHDTEAGGSGTVNRPFGKRVKGYGLTGGDVQTLTGILGRMRDARDDSDGDGKSDIEEIMAGGDPNVNDLTGKTADDYPPPVYGCRSSGARPGIPSANGGWTIAAASLFLAQWLRRKVPRRKLVRGALVPAPHAPKADIPRRSRKDV